MAGGEPFAESAGMAGENLAAPPLIGARLGLAALHRVLDAHLAWVESRPEGLRATLTGIVLAEAALDHVNLERAELKASNFIDARMSGANLSGANLQFADLRNATLIDADLSQADLVEARLGYALLAGANLSEAHIVRTSLRIPQMARLPPSPTSRAVHEIRRHGGKIRLTRFETP